MKMNKKVMTSAVKNSISDVLETMCFLPMDFAESVPLDEFWNLDKDKIVAAKLNFNGPLGGYCILYIPEKLAVSITADFMGQEEKDISNEEAGGTIKEITNMITGNAFGLYDPEAIFNLGVPELVGLDDFKKDLNDSENNILIVIDTLENYLAFQMTLRIDD